MATSIAAYALKRMQTPKGVWYWRVTFRRRGKRYLKCFYEAGYGGNAAARRAAKAWRDEQLATLSALGKRDFCAQQRSNNTSGIPGVHFLKSSVQPMGLWQAKLKVAGRRTVSRSFSVLKYGFEPAFRMAVAARQRMLADVVNEPYLFSDVAKRKSRTPSSRDGHGESPPVTGHNAVHT